MKRLAPDQLPQIPHPFERVPDGPIATLPQELLQNIASHLKFNSKSSASSVSRLFNQAIYHGEKNARVADFFPFLLLVLNSLDSELHCEQRKILSEMIEEMRGAADFPVSLFNELIKIDVKICGYKQKIAGLLISLPSDDLDHVFDSFAGQPKSPLFFEHVFLSEKYQKLSRELSQQVKWKRDRESIKELLNLGAIPTLDLLKDAIGDRIKWEILADLLKTRPDFKNSMHLNFLLEAALNKIQVDLDVVKTLIEAGAVPSEVFFKSTFSNVEATKYLLTIGVVPTTRILDIALFRKQASQEMVMIYLDAGVIPSTMSLNTAIFYQYSEDVILRMLKLLKINREKPSFYLACTAFNRSLSHQVISAFLDAGLEVTYEILRVARSSSLAAESLDALEIAYKNNVTS